MNLLDELFDKFGDTMTAEEVAGVLNVKKAGVYEMLKRGDLPGYKLPSGWVIVTSELKAHLLAHRNSYKDDAAKKSDAAD
jgi:excisionase family DNA binding protein